MIGTYSVPLQNALWKYDTGFRVFQFAIFLSRAPDVLVCRLLGGFAEFSIESETKENQDGAKPLHPSHDVAEQKNGAEDGEELSRGGDDGAGQRPKVDHRHEDEGLA